MSPRHQNFDSNGPSIRIRGNAHQVYEKYLQLARDANAAGDRIMAENMYQHAEHYFRILNVDDGEGYQSRQNRGNGSDTRYSDRQNGGGEQSEGSEDLGPDQERDTESASQSRENGPQAEQESTDEVNGGRRQPRRTRRNSTRNAAPDKDASSNGDNEAEIIVERVPVEAAQPESDAAEERPVE